jgi:hypothetical protein
LDLKLKEAEEEQVSLGHLHLPRHNKPHSEALVGPQILARVYLVGLKAAKQSHHYLKALPLKISQHQAQEADYSVILEEVNQVHNPEMVLFLAGNQLRELQHKAYLEANNNNSQDNSQELGLDFSVVFFKQQLLLELKPQFLDNLQLNLRVNHLSAA